MKPLDPEQLLHWPLPPVSQRYTERDVILYALGLGAASGNPVPEPRRRLVYEGAAGGLAVLPTLAAVLATGPFWMQDPATGIDWQRLLHGEQRLQLHKPLPAAASVTSTQRVQALIDKGAGKGALMLLERQLHDADSGELLATIGSTVFLRGNGGFGGPSSGAPLAHALPEGRAPDLQHEHATRPEQALLYRLSGDWNPLHVDPDVARAAGFDAPILHGMASYGMAGCAVIAALCDDEPARLKRLDVRFASPMLPGETLLTEIWREGPGRASFRARVTGRDRLILNNGYAEFD
ncbi:MaoC/PaaZ C-terminal domain-containing protein [Aquabacterium sp.]|uniref:MaoC/PaaZ C-terminal domain-containing protein n=1 Tax=Aquabacterium sp. TaxID=1872578 RepID=UPI002C564EF4|nr:MaoC/PaaZ C-terminal domain-containing protein [Aquabacterium sp.]HSW04938.1 MaoC/PaaZ C-terminal domain-containing protein [Aquabacterium sp.]